MRLKKMNVDPLSNQLNIDIIDHKKPFAVVFCDDKAKRVELPDFGELKIIIHQGKVKYVRFDEGEEF